METSEYLAIAVFLAVGTVLFLGIHNLTNAGAQDPRENDRLMAWRVGLQAVAVLILLAGVIWYF